MCRSALLMTCTVLIPSWRAARMMRTAISPRLAIRSFLIGTRGSGNPSGLDLPSGFDLIERLTRHDLIFVFDEKLPQGSGVLRDDWRKGLHHLDQANGITCGDGIAVVLVRRL